MKKEYFFVYIIQSKKDGSFYIGQCIDLDYRLSKHNDGFSKYSSTKRPWKLVYFESYPSRSQAIIRENEIKAKKSRRYLEYLIGNKFL
jgi:putative endonuclease